MIDWKSQMREIILIRGWEVFNTKDYLPAKLMGIKENGNLVCDLEPQCFEIFGKQVEVAPEHCEPIRPKGMCLVIPSEYRLKAGEVESIFQTLIKGGLFLEYPERHFTIERLIDNSPLDDDYVYRGVITQSPWVISSYPREHVFIYHRKSQTFKMADEETFGADYEHIFLKYLQITFTTSHFAQRKLKEIMENSKMETKDKITTILETFGKSKMVDNAIAQLSSDIRKNLKDKTIIKLKK